MFETSVIRAEVMAERRIGLLSVSFVVHVVVVAGILAASIRTIDFPTRAPNEYAIPIVTMPVQIPPALGTPDGGHKQSTPAPAKEKPAVNTANLAPNTIPEHTVPVAAATSTGDANVISNSAGSDQPEGVPWGVPNGVGVDGAHATATVAEPDVPLRIVGDVKAPVVIRRVAPLYPRTALAIHLNGTVVVECIIDKTGRVREAHVLSSTSPLFNQSAREAVEQWQFAPGSLHGQAIDTIFDLTVTFHVTS